MNRIDLESDRLVSAQTLCERLEMARSTVYSLAYRGVIPSVRLGRCVRFPLRGVEKALAERMNGPATDIESIDWEA